MELLASYAIKRNARRMFGKIYLKQRIEEPDLQEAYQLYLANRRSDASNNNYMSMYV
jgi:hypothetical protein